MSSSQPPEPLVSTSEHYRRAIRCLFGSTDSLNDMDETDKDRVLGIIRDLKEADTAGREAILDAFFQERAEDLKEFHDNVAGDMEVFLAAASEEVERMWNETHPGLDGGGALSRFPAP